MKADRKCLLFKKILSMKQLFFHNRKYSEQFSNHGAHELALGPSLRVSDAEGAGWGPLHPENPCCRSALSLRMCLLGLWCGGARSLPSEVQSCLRGIMSCYVCSCRFSCENTTWLEARAWVFQERHLQLKLCPATRMANCVTIKLLIPLM